MRFAGSGTKVKSGMSSRSREAGVDMGGFGFLLKPGVENAGRGFVLRAGAENMRMDMR